jgi:hypothetical protein
MHFAILHEAAEHRRALDVVVGMRGGLGGQNRAAPGGGQREIGRVGEVPDHMLAQIGGATQKIVVERDIAARDIDDHGVGAVPVELDLADRIEVGGGDVEHGHAIGAGLGIESAAVAADRQGAVRGLLAELIRQFGHARGHQAAILPEVADERGVGGAQIGDHGVGIDVGVADRAAHLHGLGEPLRLNPLLTLPPTTAPAPLLMFLMLPVTSPTTTSPAPV